MQIELFVLDCNTWNLLTVCKQINFVLYRGKEKIHSEIDLIIY